MSLLCPGEYETVAARSMNLARLRRAHNTPCDHALAFTLVAIMHEVHKQDYVAGKGIIPKVHFRRSKLGRKRSFSYTNTKTGQKTLRLPHEEMIYNPSVHKSPTGRLRVGVVIHEYAHLLTVKKTDNHGHLFTSVLDQLLYETEKFWQDRTPEQFKNNVTILKAAGK